MEYNKKSVKSTIKLSEIVIKVGLVASGVQLVYAFAYENNILSWFSAIFKATFIEVSVWILTQALLRAYMLARRSKVFVWALLVAVFVVSTKANLEYELKNIASAYGFFGDYDYKLSDYVDAWIKSAILPSLILGLIYARVLIAKSFHAYEVEQLRLTKQRERSRRYREKLKMLENEFKENKLSEKKEKGGRK